MKRITVNGARFPHTHAWANRILRIDLSNMTIEAREAAPYIPAYLGARGIAARIAWDEHPEPVDPFDPANPLMIFPGALTGSRSPYSGRTIVRAFSPQGYPHAWFTRSSVGARFGGELKRAGYDGVVVTGAAETPVRVRICDDEVSILPADDLWGQDTIDSLEALESIEGRGTQSFVIGPAGERLSRIATIQAGPVLRLRAGGLRRGDGLEEAQGHLGPRYGARLARPSRCDRRLGQSTRRGPHGREGEAGLVGPRR